MLKNLSQDECLVELRRQDLSSHYDFEPMKAFKLLDVDNNDSVSGEEIVNFLKKHHVSVGMEEVNDLIFDYDADSEGRIGFNEFC